MRNGIVRFFAGAEDSSSMLDCTTITCTYTLTMVSCKAKLMLLTLALSLLSLTITLLALSYHPALSPMHLYPAFYLCIVPAVDRRSIVKVTKIASGRSPIYKGFY